jgi:alkylresorcinol/alkylpyrone synthase
MPKIISVGKALPPYKLTQSDIKKFVRTHFSNSQLPIDRLLEIFENAQINERYFSVPVDWYREEHSFVEKNEQYILSCDRLGVESANDCLQAVGISPQEIDYIIFVSSTGIATPSIDARLINLLKMRPDIRRTPIWGLGCAGGAAGLSHAYHYLLAHPKHRVLIVAIELCGLTFQQNDFSRSNLVATALFGEGAAAVLMTGDEIDLGGVAVLDTRSTFWPDSLDVMGWNMMNTGMQVVFSQSIPQIVHARARANFEGFLGNHNLTIDDITYLILHPGGAKVIEAYETALALGNGQLDLCRQSLRDFGNMSAVSVLFVLADHLRQFPLKSGKYGLISALGPGFCAENLLVRF